MPYVYKNDRSKYLVKKLSQKKFIQPYLSKLKSHHYETYEHSLRVARLAVDLAYENHLPRHIIKLLGYAGLLHDFGKTRIDPQILSKPEKLTPEEYEEIKMHPRYGFLALKDERFNDIRKIVTAHHEFKKSGYPRSNIRRKYIRFPFPERRKQENQTISLLAQIIAAADMYDALAIPRAYQLITEVPEVADILNNNFVGNKILIGQLLVRKPNYIKLA